ncbi:MAG: VUT family protein [Bacteroidales bacterium]|nr:VUT family protein [Bacteroidales bacterium]
MFGASDTKDPVIKKRRLTFGATIGSMFAYLTAQFVDVHIFHALKELTKGKALWLRNNGSTLLDTIPFIVGTKWLSKYLQVDPIKDYKDTEIPDDQIVA